MGISPRPPLYTRLHPAKSPGQPLLTKDISLAPTPVRPSEVCSNLVTHVSQAPGDPDPRLRRGRGRGRGQGGAGRKSPEEWAGAIPVMT